MFRRLAPILVACACVDAAPAPAELVPPGAIATRDGLDSPTLYMPTAGGEGPFACPGELLLPKDGGFDAEKVGDADTHAVGAADTPIGLHLLPGENAAHEMFILWQTRADTVGGRVELGLAADALSWTIPASSYVVNGTSRIHVARICGLEADSAWAYRVGDEAGWSAVHPLTTAPEAGVDSPVRVAVLGDSRDGEATFATLMAAIRAAGVDLVMFTGDAVPTGNSWTEWNDWFTAGGDTFAEVPTIFVSGNHESNALDYFALFPTPRQTVHAAYDFGPVHVAMVDDSTNGGVQFTDEAAWLQADLATATAPWVLPAWHKPALSSCSPHGEDRDTKAYFLPVVDAATNVRLVVNGHNHNYERSVPMRGGVEVAGGVVHLVSGGAGAPLYTGDYKYPYTAEEIKTQHWVLLEADARTLHATAFDLAGNVLDDFTLLR